MQSESSSHPIAVPGSFFTEWLLLAGSLLVFGLFLGVSLYVERQEIETRERDRLATQARVIHDNLLRQFDAVSRALASVRSDLPRWRRDPDGMQRAGLRLRAFTDAMPGVRTMTILDARGTVIAASRPELVGNNFRERPYFQAVQQAPHPDSFYIGPPFKTSLGVWAMNVVRMVPDASGKFDGIVSATLDPDEFRILLDSVRYADDMRASLALGDGQLFLLVPEMAGVLGKNLDQPGSMFALHKASGAEATVLTGLIVATGDWRMIAQRNFQPPGLAMDKMLNVAVSRDLAAVFASWQGDLQFRLGLFALLAATSVAALTYAQRRRQRAEEKAAQAERALRQKNAEIERFFTVSPDLLLIADRHGVVLKVNPAWRPALGYGQADMEGARFIDYVHPDDRESTLEAGRSLFDGEKVIEFTNRFRAAAGEFRLLEWHAAALNADGLVYGAARDVTEQHRTAAALQQLNAQLETQAELLRAQAYVDGLTGVANRRRFDEAMAAEWRRCRRDNTMLALLMIDIDRFKNYNDHYGHQAGDECLKAVAAALRSGLSRSHDLVARYGGEEFVCLLPDSDLDGAGKKAETLRIAIEQLTIPHAVSDTAGLVTVSIGVAACLPDSASLPEHLIAAADQALYAAKRDGRNRVVLDHAVELQPG